MEEVKKFVDLSGRVWFLSLREEGIRVSREYMNYLINNNRDLIMNIMTNYSKEFIGLLKYIISNSSVKHLRVKDEPVNEAICVGDDFKYWLACSINTFKVFHDNCLMLLRDLSRIGLAIYIPAYSSKGVYLYHEYSVSGYVIENIAKLFKSVHPIEVINALYKIFIIYKASVDNRYMDYLRKYVMEDNKFRTELQAFLDILYSKGITTRLTISKETNTPLFIVLDDKGFEESLIETANQVLEHICENGENRL